MTSAWLRAGRAAEPAKITSSMPSPRIAVGRLSPITQRIASSRFDLPQPFGPDDAGQAGRDHQFGGIDEALEPREAQAGEMHGRPSWWLRRAGSRSQVRRVNPNPPDVDRSSHRVAICRPIHRPSRVLPYPPPGGPPRRSRAAGRPARPATMSARTSPTSGASAEADLETAGRQRTRPAGRAAAPASDRAGRRAAAVRPSARSPARPPAPGTARGPARSRRRAARRSRRDRPSRPRGRADRDASVAPAARRRPHRRGSSARPAAPTAASSAACPLTPRPGAPGISAAQPTPAATITAPASIRPCVEVRAAAADRPRAPARSGSRRPGPRPPTASAATARRGSIRADSVSCATPARGRRRGEPARPAIGLADLPERRRPSARAHARPAPRATARARALASGDQPADAGVAGIDPARGRDLGPEPLRRQQRVELERLLRRPGARAHAATARRPGRRSRPPRATPPRRRSLAGRAARQAQAQARPEDAGPDHQDVARSCAIRPFPAPRAAPIQRRLSAVVEHGRPAKRKTPASPGAARAPVSVRFDEPYFAVEDGLAETRHVFLAGNDLPERFRPGFRIAELGFGTGLNALAAWAAWRSRGLPGDARASPASRPGRSPPPTWPAPSRPGPSSRRSPAPGRGLALGRARDPLAWP